MKVYVLGLDGATFDVLNPLIEEGIVPNIRGLCAGGASGPLRTIFPPVTAPAWLALATGLNPGKTGVFDYINRTSADDRTMVPISSTYYENRSIWNYLNRHGLSVGIFNYPTLSPPPQVKGFAVTGMGRYGKEPLCYPRPLEEELNSITGGYEYSLNLRQARYAKNIGLFFDDIESILAKQSKALKYLTMEKEWDFFFGVFSFTDWMQHVLWKFIDERHPLHDASTSRPVQARYRQVWRRIDDVIGELLSALAGDVQFLIVSDHGAGPLDSVFYPNAWLEQKGWLRKRRLGWKGLLAERLRLFSAGSDNKYASSILHYLLTKVLNIKSSTDLLDLDHSLAYSPEHNTMFGCVSLTDRGRETGGFINKVIDEIRRLPENVEGIHEVKVYLPNDLYEGPFVGFAPDVLFVVNNYSTTVEVDIGRKAFIPAPSIAMRTGGHLPDGVFIAQGKTFISTKLDDLSILDIAPTILALYDIDIPEQIDGRVISESLTPSLRESLSLRKVGEAYESAAPVRDQDDLEEMKNTLKSLGYM